MLDITHEVQHRDVAWGRNGAGANRVAVRRIADPYFTPDNHQSVRAGLAGLGGAAAWPLVARAQQPGGRMRRIGVLIPLNADDPLVQGRRTTFAQSLQQLGWTDGRNVAIDIRSSSPDSDRLRAFAVELVALTPDVLVTSGAGVGLIRQATRTIPIVFAGLTDPVGAGVVASLARPGGNVTGFSLGEYGFSGKWLELLKQVAPNVTRVAVIRATGPGGIGGFGAIQNVAPSLGMEVVPVNANDSGDIERGIVAFSRQPNCGAVVMATSATFRYRALIIALAARHRLPTVYPLSRFVAEGGLISYGAAAADLSRLVAGYVDRILKGEKPADLPVQQITRIELAINLKTAKALGLTIPETLLATADEVIE
jgi:putative ABC transport system substrate-binding protein